MPRKSKPRVKWVLRHERYGDKPWAVQEEALLRKGDRRKFGYFLEQGLGKTSLTLNDFLTTDECDLLLIVAPNSYKLDWKYAPSEWGHPDLPAGAWPRDKLAKMPEGKRLYSVNYEAMRTGAYEELLKWAERPGTMLVFDESAEFKNHQSQTARCAIELAKRAQVVRLLNGTPIVQNVLDYYPQLRCLGELNGVNPYAFRARYAVMGGFMGKQIVGMKNGEELAKILDRCSFRALKTDWRDLPPKVYSTVRVEMTKRQTEHYMRMLAEFYTSVNGLNVTADMVLTQMDKLRQIASCLAMQDGQHEWLEEPKRNPKVQATLDIVTRGSGKTVVVHWYKQTGHMLIEEFKRQGLEPAYIQGSLDPRIIMEQKQRFNRDPKCRVIVCQQTASFRGHTLLGGTEGDRCNRMVFFENSFSYYHRSQMEDRNHRGEQDQTCHYYDLVTSPIDEKYIQVLQGKKDLANAVDDIVKLVRQVSDQGLQALATFQGG